MSSQTAASRPQPPKADFPPVAPSPRPAYQQPRAVRHEQPQARTASHRRVWVYIPIAALIIAVALLWAMRPKHASVGPTVAAKSAWPSREVGPGSSNAPQPAHAAPLASNEAAVTAPKSAKGSVWRVVVFTFSRQSDAENRAKIINEQHPDLHAEVFAPRGGSPYLVVLGHNLSREEAEHLRQRARASGLPRDSYIQNYAR